MTAMPKIKTYHRPTNVQEAIQLLTRSGVQTTIIAGGTCLNSRIPPIIDDVIDLQNAGLAGVTYTGQGVMFGAMVRWQNLVDDGRLPALLRDSARREGPNTLRNSATIGGLICSPSRESELLAALLIYDAEVQIQSPGGSKKVELTHFLRDIRAELNGGGIVTAVSLNIIGKSASARVARTPADKPIVAALARKPDDGKIRLALCGVDNVPVLVDPNNVKAAINPPNDFRGSREYRRQMAATLAQRVLNELGAK
jgi:CO/xanthine dehydrogenase FAD-binding subunit